MIRTFTFICMAAAFSSGLYLYGEKHRAELLDRQIAKVIHATEAARQRTGLLRADWALLNDPTRLQNMSDKYLALKPMAPGQFVQLADLPTHLPAAEAPPKPGSTDDDIAAEIAAATPPPAPDATDAAAPPAPAADAPSAMVAAIAPPKPATKPATKPPVKLASKSPAKKPPHPVAVADREPPLPHGPLMQSNPLPLASPLPHGARVVSAMARPTRLAASPAVVTAAAQPAFIGSALGGRASLPPPVPLGNQ
jgi:hypothetical protein